jgi:hypothetical protein
LGRDTAPAALVARFSIKSFFDKLPFVAALFFSTADNGSLFRPDLPGVAKPFGRETTSGGNEHLG